MTRGAFHVTIVIVFAIPACGARTGLNGAADTGNAGGGGVDLASPCSAALQRGAPTPMPDYCPTHAAQASATGPRAPHLVWTAQPFALQSFQDYLPPWIVIDASGRTYVAIDDSPQKDPGTASTSTVFALDPQGDTLWTRSLPGTLANPFIDRGGVLRFTGAGEGSLDAAGSSAGTLAVPPLSSHFGPLALDPVALAPASDGSFFVAGRLVDSHDDVLGGGGVARVTAAGALLWRWPAPDDPQDDAQLAAPLLVSRDDRVVVASTAGLLGFDVAGNEAWQAPPDSQLAAIDAIDAMGRLVALVTASSGDLELVTTDDAGREVNRTSLDTPVVTHEATRLALASDGTTLVLLADETPSPGLTTTQVSVLALDPSGAQRWSRSIEATIAYDPATASAHYGLFIDGGATVVVTAGAITGIELASGTVLWTLQPPDSSQCVRPAVLGIGGTILASQCDGTIFLASD